MRPEKNKKVEKKIAIYCDEKKYLAISHNRKLTIMNKKLGSVIS